MGRGDEYGIWVLDIGTKLENKVYFYGSSPCDVVKMWASRGQKDVFPMPTNHPLCLSLAY